MEPSIYEYPDVFRRAHLESPGEIPAEVVFLQQVWKRHRKSPTRRILDIACGDSPHGRLLAGDGFQVVGIDRSPTMIAAGRRKANANLRFYRRPIEKFTLPERAFDAAIFMSETFPVIVENAELLSHLKSVGRTLKRGGLYCIDIDRQDPIARVPQRTMWRERTARAAGAALDIREYHRPIAWHSPLHSIYELECTINFPSWRSDDSRSDSGALYDSLDARARGARVRDVQNGCSVLRPVVHQAARQMPLPLARSAAAGVSSGFYEMIGEVEHLGAPDAVEAQNVNRAELDDRLVTREFSHNRANHAAMRD